MIVKVLPVKKSDTASARAAPTAIAALMAKLKAVLRWSLRSIV
jgi:hypothetical protein